MENNPFILFTHSYLKDSSICVNLMNPDSHERYLFANYQVTIRPLGPIDEALSSYGKDVYDEIKEKVDNGEFKDTIYSCYIEYENSGSWFSNKDSKW